MTSPYDNATVFEILSRLPYDSESVLKFIVLGVFAYLAALVAFWMRSPARPLSDFQILQWSASIALTHTVALGAVLYFSAMVEVEKYTAVFVLLVHAFLLHTFVCCAIGLFVIGLKKARQIPSKQNKIV